MGLASVFFFLLIWRKAYGEGGDLASRRQTSELAAAESGHETLGKRRMKRHRNHLKASLAWRKR